ncbi:MAG: YeeE/YedE family protein [Planctomycetes bacterium]|nr:YeeE/YedE family protein [Planctomycetota bacterium]
MPTSTPWPFWLAGLAIGAFVPLFAAATGKVLGVSGGYTEACALSEPARVERWKLWFLLGLPLGGLASRALDGGVAWTTQLSTFEAQFGWTGAAQLAVLASGGFLVGYGARVAGGCTSGHSIVGIAIGAKSSLVATIGFMIGGFAATWALVALFGRAA